MPFSPIAILNMAAGMAVRRRWTIDPLSLAWAGWRGIDPASIPRLIGPPPREEEDDVWEARSISMRGTRLVIDHMVENPALWTDGRRLSLSGAISDDARIRGGRLMVGGEMPETVLHALPGMRLTRIISLPFSFDATVLDAVRADGHVQIGFDHKWMPLPRQPRWWRRD